MLIGKNRPTNEKLLLFLEYLYAYNRNVDKFYIYGKYVAEKVCGYTDSSTGRKLIAQAVREGLFEYDNRQIHGQGGIRHAGFGKDRWSSTTYKNLNKELVLENIKVLRNTLGLDEVEYNDEKCKEIIARLSTPRENLKSTETEEYVANDLYSEIEEYNNRVPNIAQITFLKDLKNRGSNILCQTKNPEKHPEDNKREELLNQYLNPQHYEFDINGSIYRLSYNLSHDTFFNRNEDIYKYLFDYIFSSAVFPDTPFNRAEFKKILMPCYMKGEAYFVKAEHLDRVKDLVNNGMSIDNLVPKDRTLYDYACMLDNLNLDATYEEILRYIYICFKNLYGDRFRKKHIFIDETFIMIMTANLIYKKYGKMSFYLYDALYIEGEPISTDELYALYEEATVKYKTIFNNKDKEIKDRKKKKKDKKLEITSIVNSIQHHLSAPFDNIRAKVRYLFNKGVDRLDIMNIINKKAYRAGISVGF